jgi:hypothetical protein
MIMKLKPWLNAPFAQPAQVVADAIPACYWCDDISVRFDQASGLTACESCARKHFRPAPAPVAVGPDDTVMIFRAYLGTLTDGPALVNTMDTMVRKAPGVASQVIMASSLGEVSRGRAVRSLRDYMITKVAVAPLGL